MTSNPTQTVTSTPPQAPPQPYGSMNQVSSGPAGILYSLSNQLIAIYNQVEALYNEMTVAETSVQKDTIDAGAKAQRAAASDQAWSIGCQAAGAFLGAAVTMGTTIATVKSNATGSQTLTAQEGELTNLNNLNGLQRTPTNVTTGDLSAQDAPPQSPYAQRASDLKNGTYSFATDDAGETPETIASRNQEAINSMSNSDYETFKSNLQEKISGQEKAINTTQSKIQTNQTSYQQYGQIVSGVTNTAAQSGQAVATNASGQQQAGQQVANSVTQMANSTADNTRGNIGQYYAKVSDAIAAARQGAQTYAQT